MVLRLHNALEPFYPSTFRHYMKASAKVCVVMNVIGRGAKSVTITHGSRHDRHLLQAGPWMKGRLLIFDLGFFRVPLFEEISRNGGFFLSRMRKHGNPVIVKSHTREHQELVGFKLNDAQEIVGADTLDVDAITVVVAPGATKLAIDSLGKVLDPTRSDSTVLIVAIGYRGSMLPELTKVRFDQAARLETLRLAIARLHPAIVLPAEDPYASGARALGTLSPAFWESYLTEAARVAKSVDRKVKVGVAASAYTSNDSALYAWAAAPGSCSSVRIVRSSSSETMPVNPSEQKSSRSPLDSWVGYRSTSTSGSIPRARVIIERRGSASASSGVISPAWMSSSTRLGCRCRRAGPR